MTYSAKPSSAPAIVYGSVGKSKILNDIISAIALDNLLALNADGTYKENFGIGQASLNSLVNEINIRQGTAIKEYDATGSSLLRTLALGSATNLTQGFRYLDEPTKISNNIASPLDTIDLSAGNMSFDDGTGEIRLATSLSKSTANDFQNGGLLPNGSTLQASTMYYVFAIYSTISNQVSFYADTSKTSPTLPTSPLVYDKKEYRGAFYVDAGGLIQVGNYEYHKSGYRLIKPKILVFSGITPVYPATLPLPAPIKSSCFFSGSINHSGSSCFYYLNSKIEGDSVLVGALGNVTLSRSSITPPFPVKLDNNSSLYHGYDLALGVSAINLSLHGWTENL